ncbi:hypothetical protein ACNKHM_10570 [Shigella sonnei]
MVVLIRQVPVTRTTGLSYASPCCGEAPAAPQVTAEDASASLGEPLNAGLAASYNE